MQAKVYDFDRSYDVPDGIDEKCDYVIRDVDYLSDDGTIVLKNGTRSHTCKLLKVNETICEICRPDINPLCTNECQEACPLAKDGTESALDAMGDTNDV